MIKSERHIAFLLGAGFSVPAGMPTAKTLNESLVAHIFNAIRNSFKEGNEVLPGFIFEKVLLDCDKCGEFDYEFYFDTLAHERERKLNIRKLRSFIERGMYGYLWGCSVSEGGKTEKKQIDNLVKSAKNECHSYFEVICNMENYYQHLIGKNLLGNSKNGKIKSFNPCYNGFAEIIDFYKSQGYVVDIYTLNHDLLLESLLSLTNMKDDVCDGFGGEIENLNKKAYRTFNVKYYEKDIRIFKLHGSINIHELSPFHNGFHKKYIQIIDGYSDKNAFLMNNDWSASIIPLFLTGKKSKQQNYNKEPFCTMFNLMQDSLRITEKMIVIGYSGNDYGVNEIIYDNYEKWGNAFVVSPNADKHEFVTKKNAQPVIKGVESLCLSDFSLNNYSNIF